MTGLITALVWMGVTLIILPAIIVVIEVVASFFPHRTRTLTGGSPSTAVIIPAHNESRGVINTLEDVRKQLSARDKLIVVADNCTDDTAAIAEKHGAVVLERNDPERLGKGYALQFAIDHLNETPPDCVLFVDADCRLSDGAIPMLTKVALATGRPAQALNLMQPPEGAGPSLKIAAFAWLFMNKLRMSGLSTLADVTRFTGVGLAAPWRLVSRIDFATGRIAEDLALTLTMAEMGAAPQFVPEAKVLSFFPESGLASITQRARWEHGTLAVIRNVAAPALLTNIVRLKFKPALLALDAATPPLVMLIVLLGLSVLVTAMLQNVTGAGPFVAVSSATIMLSLTMVIAWVKEGREVLPLSDLRGAFGFLLQKWRIYGTEGRASTKSWTRTKRPGEEEES